MIDLINNYASTWAGYFGLAVLQNTIFLAIVFIAFSLMKNAGAQTKYIISVIGLGKLLLLPFIPAPLLNWFSRQGDAAVGGVGIGPITTWGAVQTVVPESTLSTIGFFFLLWAIAAALYLLLAIGSTLILKSKLAKARLVESESQVHLPVLLRQSSLISTPLSIGIFPKQIFLPSFWKALPAECQTVLIRHELAHIKRRDGIVQFVQILVQAIYFFHPLVWLLNERINEYREMACDDTAVKESQLSPVEYSKYLLRVAENVVHPHWSYTSASALIRQKNKLMSRVNYQIKEAAMKPISKRNAGLIIALLFMLVLPLSIYSSKGESGKKLPGNEKSQVIGTESGLKGIGMIAGTVKDKASGKPIPGAYVHVDGTSFGAATHAKGDFKIPYVVPGVYNIRAEKTGYKDVFLQSVQVKKNLTTRISFALQVDKSAKVKKSKMFNAYDEPPQPVGGFAALQRNLVYPERARKAGVEGRVYVNVHVNEKGEVDDTRILKSLGNNGCDEAAVLAIKSATWQPAKLKGKPVAVWVGIPVVFKLNNGKKWKTDVEPKPVHVLISDETSIKVAYDTPPNPEGGFSEVQRNLMYPEIARKAGIEGRVYVNVLIDENGQVVKTKILKSLGDNGCDQAAVAAIKAVKWSPAKKDGKPVKTWVGIPVVFKLNKKTATSSEKR